MHMRGSRGEGAGGQPPENHEIIVFLSNTDLETLKTTKLSSQQCLAIFGAPAKHHLNGISLAGR